MILELRNLLPDISLLRRYREVSYANDVATHGWKSLRAPHAIYISGIVLPTCIKARPRIVYGSVDRTSQMRVTHGANVPRGIFLPRDSTYFVIYSYFSRGGSHKHTRIIFSRMKSSDIKLPRVYVDCMQYKGVSSVFVNRC